MDASERARGRNCGFPPHKHNVIVLVTMQRWNFWALKVPCVTFNSVLVEKQAERRRTGGDKHRICAFSRSEKSFIKVSLIYSSAWWSNFFLKRPTTHTHTAVFPWNSHYFVFHFPSSFFPCVYSCVCALSSACVFNYVWYVCICMRSECVRVCVCFVRKLKRELNLFSVLII